MKRHAILIYVAAVLTMFVNFLPANAQKKQTQDALYIYRNDGGFHGFFYGEIDRFEYSKVDTLGVEHDDFVVQEIYARDTVYRIPINAIDSIGFVTPENVYKKDVAYKDESELWNYVIKSDTLYTFTLAPNTPEALIPKVGDKIAKIEETPNLPYGIYGLVKSITSDTDGITVVCEGTLVCELFDQYTAKVYAIPESMKEEVNARRRIVGLQTVPITYTKELKPIHHDWDLTRFCRWINTINGNIEISDGLKLTAELNGRGRIMWADTTKVETWAFYMTSLDQGDMIEIHNKRYERKKSLLDVDGQLTLGLDVSIYETPPVPIPHTPFFIKAGVGLTYNISGKVRLYNLRYTNSETKEDFVYRNRYNFTVANTTLLGSALTLLNGEEYLLMNTIPVIKNQIKKDTLAFKGEFTGGIFGTVSVFWPMNQIIDVTGRVDLGAKINGSITWAGESTYKLPNVLDSWDTGIYNVLNADVAFQITPYASARLDFTIGGKKESHKWKPEGRFGHTWQSDPLEADALEIGLVPKFSNLKLVFDEKANKCIASADIDRKILFDLPVGFALYTKDKMLYGAKYYPKKYGNWGKPTFTNYTIEFPGVDTNQTIWLFPTVEFMFCDLLASPYKAFEYKFSMKLTPEELSFKAAGGTQSVTIEHNGNASKFNVGVSTTDEDKDWCTVKLSDNKITVKAAKNKKMKERYATITVTYGEGANMVVKEIKVTQEAAEEEDIPAANNANDLWYTFRHSSAQDASYYVLMTFGKDGSYEWNYYTPKGLSSWERGTYEVISSKPNSTVEVTYNSYVPETIEVGKWINKTGVGWFGKKEKWTNANYYRLKITYVTASNVQKTKEIEVYANSSNKVLGYEFYEDTKIPRIWYEECVWWDTDNLISLLFNGQ